MKFRESGSIISVFAAIAALAAVACSCWQRGDSGEKEEEQIEVEPPLLGFDTGLYSVDTLKIKNGDTFSVLMTRLGMSAGDAFTLSELCDTVFDVRKLRAGNNMRAFYEETDSSRVLRYAVYDHNVVTSTVFRCSDSLAVWNASKPVEHIRTFTDITISSSLWNDMIAAGASPQLIVNLEDIYQWSVNFFALQKGDRFRAIFTQTICEDRVIGIDSVYFSLFDSNDGKQVAAVLFDTGSGSNTYWDKGGESLKRMFLKAPLKYSRVSSGFSYRRKHPVTGVVRAHTAVDYAAPTGTPVYAIGDGTVTRCGWDSSGGGNRIRIKHMRGFESSYMHLSRFAPGIREGKRVSQGELIGYVGATGVATGPHLDFRIWENGKPIDPLKLDSPASEPLDTAFLQEFNALYETYMNEADSLSKARLSEIPAGDSQ